MSFDACDTRARAKGCRRYRSYEQQCNERGEAEARAAAQFVADTFGSKVTSVFASPMKRAMYGAERTVEALQREMKVEAREAIREVRRGDWVDKSIDQVSKEYPGEDMQRFLDDYDFNPAGGGESVNEVQARAKKCLLEDVLPCATPERRHSACSSLSSSPSSESRCRGVVAASTPKPRSAVRSPLGSAEISLCASSSDSHARRGDAASDGPPKGDSAKAMSASSSSRSPIALHTARSLSSQRVPRRSCSSWRRRLRPAL